MGRAAGEGEGSEKALHHVGMEHITFTSVWGDQPSSIPGARGAPSPTAAVALVPAAPEALP